MQRLLKANRHNPLLLLLAFDPVLFAHVDYLLKSPSVTQKIHEQHQPA
jgi:hypothetical protein